ncbi:beta/gamma crystallin family protein [Plectonema cf. radiosum LEGE 06105]|uniref:Beta/gamma crystallin family protein n=1 Tax=Plectonema cf. radiosum LEGE 06105 TaxID=945769 RepID=A0A8J7F5J4_9CYAN|nr:beta/gamma crystallin-related protein [Plectonema radiosum]MBE9214190.1 beta/gamma crystallin family protein [Plectonema cf. radiosum LEGE 06105]
MKESHNEQLFQELGNEVAATCSGGVAYLYQNDGFGGRKLTFYEGTNDLRRWGFNDQTSSIKIRGNERWTFYQNVGRTGKAVTLGKGDYNLYQLRQRGIANDSISSLKRVG